MIPIIGVIGRSGSGKTTLTVKVIKELVGRGYKVGAIKHTRHEIDIDQPGKDSMLMKEAGAAAVAIASPDRVALHLPTDEEFSPEDVVARLFPEVDVALVEGFGDAPIPKIGIIRKGVSDELPTEKGLIGLVTDSAARREVPLFSFDQVPQIADLVESYILKKQNKREAFLFVNGKKIFLKPFIKDLFLKAIAAMVDCLKGTEGAGRIQVIIDKPGGVE